MLSAATFGLPVERVDREKGVIYGAAICTEGEAQGHGYLLDEEFINDVVRFGNARKNGLKMRFGHPNMSSEALGTFLGRATNLRMQRHGDKAVARGDIELSDTAKETPNGNLYDYVLNLAADEPDAFGLSIVFAPGDSYQKAGPDGQVTEDSPWYAKCEELLAADMVDDPAANPDGLFSAWGRETFAGQVTEFLDAHPAVYELVAANPGVIESFMTRYQDYLSRKEHGMSKQNETPTPPPAADPQPVPAAETAKDGLAAGEAAGSAAPPAATPLDAGRDELKKFTAAFGEANGAKWFALGKTFAEAQALQVADLREQLAAKEQEIAGLKQKLSTLPPQGEAKPVTFQAEGAGQPVDAASKHLPASLRKVAGAIVLPGRSSAKN
jgi:hypothetical protein